MKDGHKGNFDLIRLLAASAVVFSHGFILSSPLGPGGVSTGRDPLQSLAGAPFTLGTLAVYVFFALSGYLVAQSWLADPRLRSYLARRALRIMPGLTAAVIVTVLVVGPIATSLSIGDFASSPATRSYLGNALLYHEQLILPGVFQHNVWTPEVNDSLWTLRYEFTWYLSIPVIAMAGAVMARRVAPVLLAGGLASLAVMPAGASRMVLPTLDVARMLVFFSIALAGMVLYVHRDAIPMRGWLALSFTAIWVAAWHTQLAGAAGVIAVAYGSVYLATRRPLAGGRLAPRIDLSYGTYLYGFLCEQVAVAILGGRSNALSVLALAGPLTLACATLSWRFVETPALRLKSRITRRRVEAPPAVTSPVIAPA